MTARRHHENVIPIAVPTPFIVGPVNVYLIKGHPLTLIDTGPQTDEAYEILVEKLSEYGHSITDLESIFLTHAHIDHMGLAARLADESGATLYAHETTAAQLEHVEETQSRIHTFVLETLREFGAPKELIDQTAEVRAGFHDMAAPVAVHNRLHDGDKALGFDVHHVPGHSSSDTLFVDPARRLAFSGDHVLKRISPNPLMRRPKLGEPRVKSLVEYQRSLRRTREIDFDVCYPGHGEPITNHRSVIDTLIERQERRTAKIKALVESQSMTPHQICMALFPEIAPQYYYLGVSVAIGHLEVLEDRGEIAGEIRDGVLTYSAVTHAAP